MVAPRLTLPICIMGHFTPGILTSPSCTCYLSATFSGPRRICALRANSSLRQKRPLLTGHQTHPSQTKPARSAALAFMIDQTLRCGDAGRTMVGCWEQTSHPNLRPLPNSLHLMEMSSREQGRTRKPCRQSTTSVWGCKAVHHRHPSSINSV